MRVLVTGGTGKVGNAVARFACTEGHETRALVRDVGRANAVLPPAVELVTGDVTDPSSLVRAVDGCEVVFNAMGLPEQWLADSSMFDRVNVDGSANLVRAASMAGVRRLVHTSTIDVFDAKPGGQFDETTLAKAPKHTPYERSKQRAEQAVHESAGAMEVVFANPATVYGLGPSRSVSIENQLFRLVLRGLLPAVPPGGFGVVFTESLAQGHLLAAEFGRPGERYILCDEHTTLMRLARTVVSVTGRGQIPPVTMPVGVARAMAAAGEAVARVTHRAPPMARGQLEFMLWNAVPDSAKAQRELGWKPTPLEVGVRRTVNETGLS